jgi:hypothetical protein
MESTMMQVRIKTTVLLLAIAGLLSGCTTLSEMARHKQEKPDVVIRPRGVYEECVPINPPQVIDYSFSTSKPVEFNIHYHGDEVVYPVKGQAVETWQGTFDPTCIRSYSTEQPPFFCLMWTNPQEEAVGLNFEFTIRDKE